MWVGCRTCPELLGLDAVVIDPDGRRRLYCPACGSSNPISALVANMIGAPADASFEAVVRGAAEVPEAAATRVRRGLGTLIQRVPDEPSA